MNQHTPGPLTVARHNRDLIAPTTPHNRDGMIAVTRYLGNAEERIEEHAANARLLAASFNAFDKAGRELGIDAATLAERIDLAALIRAAHGALAYVESQSEASRFVHPFAPALMPLRESLPAID